MYSVSRVHYRSIVSIQKRSPRNYTGFDLQAETTEAALHRNTVGQIKKPSNCNIVDEMLRFRLEESSWEVPQFCRRCASSVQYWNHITFRA